MESLLRELIERAELDLAVLGLVAARVAPLTIVTPWLSMRGAPNVLRAALIFSLTLVFGGTASTAAVGVVADANPLVYAGWVLREAIVGTVFALAISLPIFALDWAGRLVDTWRGASLAEIIAPNTGERTSPVGGLYILMAVAVFLALGGHRAALQAFALSFDTAPIGQGFGTTETMQEIALQAAELTASALSFALVVASPAAAAIVLVELGLGLLARTAPQVPVFFAGMPLRAATGLSAMLLGLAVLSAELPSAFRGAIDIAARWMGLFGGS